jgi:hypothetical protein
MSMYGTCSLCGEEIYEADYQSSCKQRVGWVPIRGRRGGESNWLAKQDTGAVAHGRCVADRNSKLKRGIAPSQKGLF